MKTWLLSLYAYRDDVTLAGIVPVLAKAPRLVVEPSTDLLPSIGYYPSQLSGGEQQRVAIARALVNGPKVVLADEPTGNLDSKSGGEIITLLERICKEEGTAMVVVTHDSNLVKRADSVWEMHDGVMRRVEANS